jgi:hypothetical protein
MTCVSTLAWREYTRTPSRMVAFRSPRFLYASSTSLTYAVSSTTLHSSAHPPPRSPLPLSRSFSPFPHRSRSSIHSPSRASPIRPSPSHSYSSSLPSSPSPLFAHPILLAPLLTPPAGQSRPRHIRCLRAVRVQDGPERVMEKIQGFPMGGSKIRLS